MTLAKSCEPLGKPGQPTWTDPEVHRLVNPNQGLPGSRWKNAQFQIRSDLLVASTLVVLCNLGHPGGYSKAASSWLYPSGFPNQRVPSNQARFPDPLPNASGSGNLTTSGHLILVVTLPTTVCPLIFANSPTQNWCLQVIPFTTLNIHFFWQQCG